MLHCLQGNEQTNADKSKWLSLLRNMKLTTATIKLRHLPAEMITQSNDCVLVKCNMEENSAGDTGAFEKSQLWILCRAFVAVLWCLKTMGAGVCIAAWSNIGVKPCELSKAGNMRNELEPKAVIGSASSREWPILLGCIWSAGSVSKGSSIDVCGRSMNHFNGCFPPWSGVV